MTKVRELHARWASADLGENPEGRAADRQLGKLGVDAAELVAALVIGLLDLDAAHRQRLPLRADRAEAPAPPLGLP